MTRAIADDAVTFGKKSLPRAKNSSIIAVRHPESSSSVIVGLTAHSDAAVAGLARKLPHYGKYSYLAFEGDEPQNVAKGQWPAIGSPLVAILDQTTASTAKLKPRPALAMLKPAFDSQGMMQTVKTLSSKPYEGRGAGTNGLDKAANYIANAYKQAGVLPGGEDGYLPKLHYGRP